MGVGGGVPHFFTAKTNFTPHHINTIFPLQGMVLLTAVNVVVVTLLWYFDIWTYTCTVVTVLVPQNGMNKSSWKNYVCLFVYIGFAQYNKHRNQVRKSPITGNFQGKCPGERGLGIGSKEMNVTLVVTLLTSRATLISLAKCMGKIAL